MEQTIEVVPNRTNEAAGTAPTRRFASAGESTFVRLKLRWPWVLLFAIVGAAAGLLLTGGATTYITTATMQINNTSQDSTEVKQIGQTVERTATSSAVVKAAATARDTSESNLSPRVTAQWITDTDIVNINVRGTDPKGIVQDANAVVTSLEAFYDKQTKSQIAELSDQGNQLLETGKLDDAQAEAARRAGVGSALATQQGDAAAGFTTVTLLDSANTSLATGLSKAVAVVLGLFVGAVLSAAVVLLIPFRRRRLRRVEEVPVLLHGIRGVNAAENGAAEVAGLFLESERVDLAVVAMPGAEDAATSFGADVMTLLRAHGVSAGMLDATDTSDTPEPEDGAHAYSNLAAFRFLGQSGRRDTRRELRVSTLVLVSTARTEPLALLAGQGEVLAVVLTKSGRQRTRDLDSVVTQLRHSDPSVVLLP